MLYSHSGGHEDRGECEQKSPEQCEHLTLTDLQTPDVPPSQSGCVCQESPVSGTAERRAAAGSLTPPSPISQSASFKSVEMESFSARLRQENACLSVQDEQMQLISDLDAMQYELSSSRSQSRLRGPRLGVKSSLAVMSEQIRQLQAELETQTAQLKATELRADCSQEAAAHSDILVANLTEDVSALREELDTKTALCKRAEQQRNQALQNAEKLKEAFKEYRATVMESESKLKESLIECDREKEQLEVKCSLLERGKVEQSQTIWYVTLFYVCRNRKTEKKALICLLTHSIPNDPLSACSQLTEEARQARSAAAGLQAQLEEAGRKALHLERQLTERGAEFRELASLRTDLENLRTLTQRQEQSLVQSQREAQQSQREAQQREAELAGLEATLTLLHLREVQKSTIHKSQCWCGGDAVCQALHASPSGLFRNCTPAESEASNSCPLFPVAPLAGEGYQQLLRALQLMEAERSRQSSLVERLQERLSRSQEETSTLQSSMAQRASHYQSLHSELLDRVSHTTDKEKELKRKSARVAALEKQLQEKTSAYSQAALTNTELENQLLEKKATVQHYQSMMSKKQKEYQQSLENCQNSQSHQLTEHQHRIEMLQLCVEEAETRMLEMEQNLSSVQMERDELRKFLSCCRAPWNNSHSELQTSLSECREELVFYLQQMEEVKKNYESELQKNKDKVSSLQEKLHSTTLVCQSSGEQNLQLQLSLQQQQSMLTESSAHISELEEMWSSSWSGPGRLCRASHLKSEMVKCRGELVSKDSELHRLQRDVTVKTSQISCMDESLQQLRSLLNSKSDTVMDLEEQLHRCEADRSNVSQRLQVLEGQLQAVRTELTETLEQLRELRDVLQRTQTTADERQASVEKLIIQLSETQRELEERTQREHKQEMERKVESLQQSLEARERELRDTQRELTHRNMKESQEHDQQLRVCQQQLHTIQQQLEEAECRCEDLTRELHVTKLHKKEKEARLCELEEELALKRKLELEQEREQHSKELESLQQTRGQLLKVSSQISSTMLSSQEQLATKLQQSQNQLDQTKTQLDQTKEELDRARSQAGLLQTQRDQAETQLRQSGAQLEQSRVLYQQTRAQNLQLHTQLELLSTQLQHSRVQAAQLQAQLQASRRTMETSNESLLIKPERAAERQHHLYTHTSSLLALSTVTHSSESSSPPSSPHKTPATLPSPEHAHLPRPRLTPPPHTYLPPASAPRLSIQSCDWLSNSVDSSLDLPLSLKETLKEALSKHPVETQEHGRDTEAPSMQLGDDEEQISESRRESVNTLVGEEVEGDMSSLTGMLRFVNKTLAMQEDASLWSSTGPSQSSLTLQVTTPPV
ncbi:hypothetical protein F7725_011978 [Dissostichus mawsoni]|uniref:Coiled-coil domain containing 18 n=1 Tax=Dissostichus mawsoni TaxID=36200 RepID=A0A7J5ZDI4_DISMA|nr:hypothetical protein F7725_011978 [Dissostichus mawsoni]